MKHMIEFFLFCSLSLLSSCFEEDENRFRPGSAIPSGPSENELDYTVLTKENHPRLLLDDEEFEELKTKISTSGNGPLATLHETVMNLCDWMGLSGTPLTYKLDASNKRILGVSQEALLRIFTCAYAYRYTGDSKYLEHAEADINAVCDFTDWNSKRHFLDAGEMAAAVGLGYDWLYDQLSEATRKKVEQKLVDCAFTPAQKKIWNLDFYKATNNWNQVCNGGLVCGALAVYETCSVQAQDIIERAIESNVEALKVMYAPDGNYPEGPGYWCYGTLYEALMLTALETTVGSDAQLSQSIGFDKTAEYMLFTYGAVDKCFNYADNLSRTTPAIALWYFADRFADPSLLYYELKQLAAGGYSSCTEARLLPLLMTYANRIDFSNVTTPSRKIFSGRGDVPVVMVHTDWTMTTSDVYLGIKGGMAGANHGHMDAGSFVFDAEGIRWSMDYDRQSYAALENALKSLGGNLWTMTQESMRWDVFRYNNRNHSTITINDAKHLVDGSATLYEVIESDSELGATLRMTDVVSDQVASAMRTVKLVDEKDLVVIDRIDALPDRSAKVRWTMVSQAEPEIEDNRIVLTSGSHKRYLTVRGDGAKVTLRTWSTDPEDYDSPVAPYEDKNPGTYLLGFEATIPVAQQATFIVTLTPDE